MPILSPARVTAIIEQTAKKHQLDVRVLLCGAWRRECVQAREEIAYRMRNELGLSFRDIGSRLGVVATRARTLFLAHSVRLEHARRLLDIRAAEPVRSAAGTGGPVDSSVQRQVREAHARIAQLEADLAKLSTAADRAEVLEADLERLSGADLAMRLSNALEIGGHHRGPFGAVLMLSILASNYPNCVLGEHLIELYDEGSARLGWGRANGANHVLMAKNSSNISKIFRARGWVDPVEVGVARARRLTDLCAAFLAARCPDVGIRVPAPASALATQKRSSPVRSVAA